jgi:hypothetical protein
VAFKQDNSETVRLVDDALADPEVAERLRYGQPKDLQAIRDELLQQREEIWSAAKEEMAQLDLLEGKLAADHKRLSEVQPATTARYRILDRLLSIVKPIGSLAVLAYVITSFAVGWDTTWHWLNTTLALSVASVTVLAVIAAYLLHRPLKRDYDRRLTELRATTSRSLEIERTEALLVDARRAVFRVAYNDGALKILRGLIDRHFAPLFATRLDITRAPGLDSGPDPNFEITTEAHEQLMFMIKHMTRGSIGIAGPRGAGKSTLINSVCNDDVKEIAKFKALTVLTSAPVEYQSREYLLHLFASVCHRVLERWNPDYKRSEWQKYVQKEEPLSTAISRALLTGAVVFVFLGLGLVGASAVLTSWNLQLHEVEHAIKAVHSKQAQNGGDEASESGTVTAARFLKELGLPPASFWDTGWGLFVVGVALLVILTINRLQLPAEAERKLEKVAQPSVKPATPQEPGYGRPLRVYIEIGESAWRVLRHVFPLNVFSLVVDLGVAFAAKPVVPKPELVEEAQRWLNEIKFQQSFTSGWSGSLKLPLGVSGGLKRARSLAQLQLTLPEIVDGLVRFLRQASLDYQIIVIGIDELDKLESDEKAERFLNEIKAIFGIKGVFYLISVSENAMSRFERRGLPFRDAFDSSFDDVIPVHYLDFGMTRKLLAQRVVGMPIQFQALCHCLSGGLARELIRTSRELVKRAQNSKQRDLASLCQQMVTAELRSRVRAVAFTAEKIKVEPMRGELLRTLDALNRGDSISAELLEATSDGLSTWVQSSIAKSGPKRQPRATSRITSLAEEAAVYLRYLATVLRLFDNTLDQASFVAAERDGRIEVLSQAMQALSVNHAVASALLETLRSPPPASAKSSSSSLIMLRDGKAS